MRTFDSSSDDNAQNFNRLGKRIAKLGFWFFLIKGLLWLVVPFVLSYISLNS
ncbi:MAG: hypothetical protein HYV29_04440 [Ignavibacteriales bacterium]|nr:hypothetical protein [Ignavibacteriales bacterium]